MLTNLARFTIIIFSLSLCITNLSLAASKEDKPKRHTVRISGSQTQAKISPRTLSLAPNTNNLIIFRNTTSQDQALNIKLIPSNNLKVKKNGFIESKGDRYVVDDKGEASLTIKPATAIKIKMKLEG
tara:strand:- start:13689 stop:14069 length:381 start_codon:yes stop_codon:yes gene_type:complete